MNSVSKQACVAIIAGEASGDQHGAKLVRAMLKKNPALFFCGIGGPALRQAGVRILVEASELTVVGITEVLSKIPVILKGMGIIKKLLKSLKPDLLILIDFPDFNLHVSARRYGPGVGAGLSALQNWSIIWRSYCPSSSRFTGRTMSRRLLSDILCLIPHCRHLNR